jgi:hypothetical protein
MTIFSSETLTVRIDCVPAKVYEFTSNPANFPKWVTSFCISAVRTGEGWKIETTQGSMKLRFAEKNKLGVLDHFVHPESGEEVYVPMRVISNGSGSELNFTLFRLPGMTDEKYAEDMRMVEQDMNTLKGLLEG